MQKMKKAEKPFDGLLLGGPYKRRDGRNVVRLFGSDTDTTMSYARYLLAVNMGRKLLDEEHVDHIDNDKTNDSVDNLQVLTERENHTKYIVYSGKTLGGKRRKGKYPKRQPLPEVSTCAHCEKVFKASHRAQEFCSEVCYNKDREVIIWPSSEKLSSMVWSMPTVKIAEQLGVSDKAINKRCKKYGISKPPRGYWAKPENRIIGS